MTVLDAGSADTTATSVRAAHTADEHQADSQSATNAATRSAVATAALSAKSAMTIANALMTPTGTTKVTSEQTPTMMVKVDEETRKGRLEEMICRTSRLDHGSPMVQYPALA